MKKQKNGGKINNGNQRELGDDGNILHNCIPCRLVHIWFTRCRNISTHCNDRDGYYPIQIDVEIFFNHASLASLNTEMTTSELDKRMIRDPDT